MMQRPNQLKSPDGRYRVKAKIDGIPERIYPLIIENGVPILEFPVVGERGAVSSVSIEIRPDDLQVGETMFEYIIKEELSNPYFVWGRSAKQPLDLGNLYIALNAADPRQAALKRGKHILFATNGANAWENSINLLKDFFFLVIGRDWLNGESRRSSPSHPLAIIVRLVENEISGGIFDPQKRLAVDLSNPLIVWFFDFSFHLFTLATNQKLEERMLKRLRDPDNFWSTVHEIFVASSFMRNGFDIELEDESDRSSRHPEFYAIHKATKYRFAVEAKLANQNIFQSSNDFRNWKNPKGFRFLRLINDAIDKNPSDPLLIIVDLNRLPLSENGDQEKFDSYLFNQLHKRLISDRIADRWARIEFVNRPALFCAARSLPLTFSRFTIQSFESNFQIGPISAYASVNTAFDQLHVIDQIDPLSAKLQSVIRNTKNKFFVLGPRKVAFSPTPPD